MPATRLICRNCLEEFDEQKPGLSLCTNCLHVRFCLDTLQEAQNLVEKARQLLCPAEGFADEWTALAEPYYAVKKAWYMVESRRQALRPICSCGSELVAIGRCPTGHLTCNGCSDTHEDCGG